ncbi:hypothetical protein RRG08_018741 [Elysia crispata]|uniref:Uncharacterized protein n=1 Tax=Elysia crispata TaxID=231223 RepID=A0AAE0XTF2_9GAST|nr:hypothetical protein RRG08_018741 [Elysia crispata]
MPGAVSVLGIWKFESWVKVRAEKRQPTQTSDNSSTSATFSLRREFPVTAAPSWPCSYKTEKSFTSKTSWIQAIKESPRLRAGSEGSRDCEERDIPVYTQTYQAPPKLLLMADHQARVRRLASEWVSL